jgi:GTP-binding protein HflX
MKSEGASVLIMGNILKPLQIYNLNEKLREHKITAWDRIDLILKIFERHANSPEAKLQIELASIKHM